MSSNVIRKCKMIVFSDIHYASNPREDTPQKARKISRYATVLIDKLIEKLNEIQPDIVVNLGDLIEDSKNYENDTMDLKLIWQILQKIKQPFYSLVGNHDLRSMNTRNDVEQIMGYDNATFSIDLNGYHFVFLGLDIRKNSDINSASISMTSFISEEDMKWLKTDLINNKNPCLIFNHYGIAQDDMKGNWWFEKKPEDALLKNRDELKQIMLKDKNIIAVFSGHQHWTKHLKEGSLNYYICGSLTEDIHSNGIPDGVFLEVSLEGRHIQVNEHHLKI